MTNSLFLVFSSSLNGKCVEHGNRITVHLLDVLASLNRAGIVVEW